MSVSRINNQLLLGLSASDRALIATRLIPVDFELRQVLESANAAIGHIYFPESGVISVLAGSSTQQIEVGIVGREGMTGIAVVLADQRSPHETLVQIAGDAWRISAEHLRGCMESSATLRRHFTRYSQVFFVQVAHTAFANGKAPIDVRLARWLLMVHDRCDSNDLFLTHGFIAQVLGVRRPSVTEALLKLEGKGLVRTGRGVISVVRRKGLLSLVGASYGVPESEYARLLR